MVMAPAKTGNDKSNRNVVTRIDQTNRGIRCKVKPGALILRMVVMKFIELKIDDAPARCKLNITKSTAGPGCPAELDKGG